MSNLVRLAEEYRSHRLVRNPPVPHDYMLLTNEFCLALKYDGHHMSDYDWGQWAEALSALGVSDDRISDCMAQVADWGVDD